jgi:hypothetical protein
MANPIETLGAENSKAKDVSLDAYSIREFCRRHSISRSTYYNMRKAGKGPAESHVMGRVIITKESAFKWRQSVTQQAA